MVADPARVSAALGVVDLLHQYLYSPDEFAFAVGLGQIDLAPYLIELAFPKTDNPFAQGGRLRLMPSGNQETYGKRLEGLSRRSRAFARVRKPLSKRIRQVLLDAKEFDYVLVDARTGLSDEGYIAAKFLCDSLVVLTGLNDQNLLGTADFLGKVAAWREEDEGPKKIAIVASPVCEHEDEAKRERLRTARSILGEIAGAGADFAVLLPYHPRMSLCEELVLLRWPESELGLAYERLTQILRNMAGDATEA